MHVSAPAESDQTLPPVLGGAIIEERRELKRDGIGKGLVKGASQETSHHFFWLSIFSFSLPFNWSRGTKTAAAHLHDDEEVKDQDEGSQESPGDLVTGQEAPVQVVPADPVCADDQQHHRRQRDEHCPVRTGGWDEGGKRGR